MIYLSTWNVRGLNDPIRQVDVKKFMLSNKVQFITLLETRVKKENSSRVVQMFGSQWGWLNNYNSRYNSRIWILWTKVELRVSEVLQMDQLMHVEVCSVVGDVKFLCSIIYAFNSFDGRVALWEQFRALDVANVPWIISRDFNTTLHYGERVKLSGVVWGDTFELQQFVSRMEVFDLQISGAFFTWCNKQGENDKLWCKLDKVMANSTWVSAFPNTSVVFLNLQSSDHSPSLVTMDLLMNDEPKPFRFCNAWSKDERFLGLVSEVWSSDIQGCPMFVVVQKFKLVK
ncbi:hypothetical protein SLE2022_294050 [Rubroshorea leprosula]